MDLAEIRTRLAAGADPNRNLPGRGPVLHVAAQWGSAAVVAELARRVDDIDAPHDGRTALWVAVAANMPDNARVLATAGADPWRPMMAGWSPGRLSLASRTPDLFAVPSDAPGLSRAEAEVMAEAHRLIGALGDAYYDGLSLSCVRGVTAAEAVRRLKATPFQPDDPETFVLDMWDGVMNPEVMLTVGVTDVPGGCVVTQPWGYGAQMPGVSGRLSIGTVCYAMYANPKSGNQGSVFRDGVIEGWDLHAGGDCDWCASSDPADEILRTYLCQGHALAYCCSYVGLKLADARAIVGPPDLWVDLPPRDYWSYR